jgi:hypothetical protein
MAPGWTSYNHRLVYQAFDVRQHLSLESPNVLGIEVAEGWFPGRIGFENNWSNVVSGHLLRKKRDADGSLTNDGIQPLRITACRLGHLQSWWGGTGGLVLVLKCCNCKTANPAIQPHTAEW